MESVPAYLRGMERGAESDAFSEVYRSVSQGSRSTAIRVEAVRLSSGSGRPSCSHFVKEQRPVMDRPGRSNNSIGNLTKRIGAHKKQGGTPALPPFAVFQLQGDEEGLLGSVYNSIVVETSLTADGKPALPAASTSSPDR